MPVATIDLPTGLPTSAKQRLVRSVAEAIHAAYRIPNTRVFALDDSMAMKNPMVIEGMEAALQAQGARK
jgi:phenylpyruvate tautomerase PptA (4-oxalocrotonate tautomerase family)